MENDHLKRSIFFLSQFPKTQPWVSHCLWAGFYPEDKHSRKELHWGRGQDSHVRCDRTYSRRWFYKDKSHEPLLPKFYTTSLYPARISACFGLESLQTTWLSISKISLRWRIEKFRKKLLLKHTGTQVQIKPCPVAAHKPSVHTSALNNTTCLRPGRKC